jgi:hypothetical protein
MYPDLPGSRMVVAGLRRLVRDRSLVARLSG